MNAENELTEYGYNSLNRLVAITNEGVEVATFDHDNNGNLVEQTFQSAHSTFGYDGMNLMVASTQTVGSTTSIVGYQHDLNGNRTHVTYPGGTNAIYVYGADNRLESIDLSAFGISSAIEFKYDSASRLTNIVYPNGVNSSFGLDAESRVVSIQHGTFVDCTIQRNVLGFKQTELIDAGLKPTVPDTRRTIKTHNDADQLTSEWVQQGTNEYTVSYDYSANGCLTSAASSVASLAYEYDYDNRLQSVDGGTTEYLYDASGTRVGRIHNSVTNYFVLDYTDGLKRPLAETDSSGTVTRYYVWSGSRLLCHIDTVAGGGDPGGTVRYYHSDELGSTLALTDSSGTVTDQFAYMPYGYASRTGTTQTPFRWLGSFGVYYDSATDLHLTLHRAYSSRMKRFISSDPLGIDGFVNLYAYGELNPVWLIDPFGLDSYLASRPLGGNSPFFSHNFVVSNAEYLGDPNATVYSYGRNAQGNVGMVDENTQGFSLGTHQSDRDAWLALRGDRHTADVLFITDNDATVDDFANRFVEDQRYSPIAGPFGANSNSGAQAIANRAAGRQLATPGWPRSSPGAGSWDEIQFRDAENTGPQK